MDEKIKYLLSELPEELISKFKYDEVALYSMTPSHIAKNIAVFPHILLNLIAMIF